MEFGINRNASGYYDPTAFQGIKNYIKSEEKNMNLFNGDIVTVLSKGGQEREAVILSAHDKYSTILILSDKQELPYMVNCKGMKYTDPGMVQYTFNSNICGLIRSMSDQGHADIMHAVVDALGYTAPESVEKAEEREFIPPVANNDRPFDNAIREEMAQLKAERNVYKELYENLIDSMIAK